MEERSFNVYKGLQKPIVLYGLKGENIAWALGTFAVTMVMFIALSSLAGTVPAIAGSLLPAVYGGYKVWHKMTYGLHDKKRHKGVLIVKRSMSSLAN